MRALENLTVWEPVDLLSKLERFISDDSGLSTKDWILKGLLTVPDNEKEKARLVQIKEKLAKNSGKYFLPKNVVLAEQEVEYVGKNKVGYFPEISIWTPLKFCSNLTGVTTLENTHLLQIGQVCVVRSRWMLMEMLPRRRGRRSETLVTMEIGDQRARSQRRRLSLIFGGSLQTSKS